MAIVKGTTALLPAKRKVVKLCSLKGNNAATVTPKKQMQDVLCEEGTAQAKLKADPIVAFSRPPPMPPVLGPLIALSLLENWLDRDRDGDR